MTVYPPHGPVYEEAEFWYDLKEKALLYESNFVGRHEIVEADHERTRERGHMRYLREQYHWHHQPHGIYLLDRVIGESRRRASLSNIELLIRLWLQVEKDEQPQFSLYDERPLLPVPKVLALFMDAKQAQMYKDESLALGLSLLQTYMSAKAITQRE